MARRFAFDPPDAQPLARELLVADGWEETSVEAGDWDLLWTLGEPGPGVYAQLRPGQRVAHLPGIGALARKDSLAATLARAHRLLAARGAPLDPFHPETHPMPEAWPALRARAHEEPGALWIQKPRAAARGDGIRVLADIDSVETGSTWLVQRYLDRPHLIGGRKYTLRCYVLVDGLDPLSVRVFEDGFTKLASRPFSTRPDALADRFAHLTNPDILALDAGVPVSRDNLTRPAYAELLRAEGHDPDALFARIHDLLAATIAAARDELALAAWTATNHPAGCFELLGLDIAVDDALRPWLIECNLDPSLAVEAAASEPSAVLERELKTRLVAEALRAVGALPAEPAAAPAAPRLVPLLPDPAPGGRGRLVPLPRAGEHAAPPVLAPASGLTVVPLADGLALHEPVAGAVHVLDALAAYLFAAHEEGLAPEEIAAEVAATWPEAAWRAEADVRNTLATWHELGLSVPAGPGVPPPAPLPEPAAARPRLRWNRERTYRLLDTALCVTVPDDELDGWLQAALAPLEDDAATAVHARAELLLGRSSWELAWDGGRLPVRSARQAGSLVRALLLRAAVEGGAPGTAPGAAAFPASLLADGERVLLVLGAHGLRAPLVESWLRDGGSCLGDDLVLLHPDGRAEGRQAGLEIASGTESFGPLAGLGDPDAVHVAAGGAGFVRVRWPQLAHAAGPVAVHAILAVEGAAHPDMPFAPLPRTSTEALRTLLGTLPAGARTSAAHLHAAAALAAVAPAFASPLTSAGIGLDAGKLLPPFC